MQKRRNNIISYILIAIISVVRPFLGPANCYFETSCTKFAQQQLLTQPLYRAIIAIIWRIILCSPIYPLTIRFKNILRS